MGEALAGILGGIVSGLLFLVLVAAVALPLLIKLVVAITPINKASRERNYRP